MEGLEFWAAAFDTKPWLNPMNPIPPVRIFDLPTPHEKPQTGGPLIMETPKFIATHDVVPTVKVDNPASTNYKPNDIVIPSEVAFDFENKKLDLSYIAAGLAVLSLFFIISRK
jgi:hypothetical protein